MTGVMLAHAAGAGRPAAASDRRRPRWVALLGGRVRVAISPVAEAQQSVAVSLVSPLSPPGTSSLTVSVPPDHARSAFAGADHHRAVGTGREIGPCRDG